LKNVKATLDDKRKNRILCEVYGMGAIKNIILYRRMIRDLVMYNFRTKYAGSLMGMIWIVLYPIILMSIYTFVFTVIFKIRFGAENSSLDYALMVFCGLIPFLSFSEGLAMGTTSIIRNPSLVRNTLFPIDILAFTDVITHLTTLFVGLTILIPTLAITGHLDFAIVSVPFLILNQVIFTIGLVWILSSLSVFYRDIVTIVAVFLMVLMFLSPVLWTESMVSGSIKKLLMVNPLYYLISGYRNALMFGQFPSLFDMVALFFVSLFTFFIGSKFFEQCKDSFTDLV